MEADFFEEAPCGYVVLALDGTLLQANRAFHVLTGQTEPLFQKRRFQDLLSRAGGMFYETQFTQVILLRDRLTEVAFDLIGADGVIVPVLVNAVLRRDNSGKPHDIFMAVFNASRRRAYEQDLLQARKIAEQMVEVIRHSSDAIITLTTGGDIQTWNKGAEQIFGYAPNEVKGKSLLTLLFVREQEGHIREAIALLGRGRSISREFVGVNKTGKRMELSVNLTPHMEAPGILVAFSAILRDVTTQRDAEKALIRSEKLASVGRLASSIAHEINNPLEAVTNLLYILQSQVVSEEAKGLVTTAQEELARVSHIANHTLRFHRQSTKATDVDLGELFNSILGLYRGRFNNSGINVDVRTLGASPLRCYDGEMRQILMNLISNAFDATRSGGRLILACRDITLRDGLRGARITIADSGTGIDAAVLEHIFEAFYTTKGIGGTGLGLWIIQELIEKAGGSVRVRSSTKPGRSGTVFVLTFPHLREEFTPMVLNRA
ncbi:PAS domain S-box protein [Tunturibacter empetritectus]|uniref:PAS domain S-box protein n=1 Tax=Tunturiibacter empetritectus TaxID=3069691 RepID=UPI00288B6721|nr:PAS domain S-box protein [Edaphobacter lichenicola]